MAPILDPANTGIEIILSPGAEPLVMAYYMFVDDITGQGYEDLDDNSSNYFMEKRRKCGGGGAQVISTLSVLAPQRRVTPHIYAVDFQLLHTDYGHPGLAANPNEVIAMRFFLPIERLSAPLLTIDTCLLVDVFPGLTRVHLT